MAPATATPVRIRTTLVIPEMNPTTVYVVMWNDRHTDPTATLFATPEAAVEWGQATAREYDRHGDLDETLTDPMRSGGWLYHATYSCEGDSVWVTACDVRS